MSDVWYYAVDGKPVGPFAKTELIGALSRMPRAENTLVWRSDFPDWRKASELSELLPYVAKPPPLPPPPPALPPKITISDTTSGSHTDERTGATSIIGALFSFRGRLNRTQYGLTVLLGYLAPLALFFAFESQTQGNGAALTVIRLVWLAWMFWVFFASMTKRFHDLDKPGYWCLLVFVPLVGTFTPIVMFFFPGSPEANQYGPPT